MFSIQEQSLICLLMSNLQIQLKKHDSTVALNTAGIYQTWNENVVQESSILGQSLIADPAGFDLIIDGVLDPNSPYSYNGTGPQSVQATIAGDGAAHTIEIKDATFKNLEDSLRKYPSRAKTHT